MSTKPNALTVFLLVPLLTTCITAQTSTAPDTDFTAKLVDVYPPSKDFPVGFDLGVQDGIIRARYRNLLEHAELMKPGDVYQISKDMYTF